MSHPTRQENINHDAFFHSRLASFAQLTRSLVAELPREKRASKRNPTASRPPPLSQPSLASSRPQRRQGKAEAPSSHPISSFPAGGARQSRGRFRRQISQPN